MADILPECLIQKILSFLSLKDATKMSILSKTWLQASLTLPTLKFILNQSHMKIVVDNIMERYRKGKIPIEKFELSDFSDHSREVFPMIDKWLDIGLQNGVKDLVFRVPNFLLPIFKIFAAKTLRELVVWGCTLMPVSLSSSVVNCNSLRNLSLSYVTLDENMLQILINSCPLIVSFILKYCSRLEKIELLNFQKIKSISIRICKNQHVKIEAPTLEHLFYSGLSEGLDVVECQNLKSLELSDVYISDGFLQHLISRSQFLESLILDDIYDLCERFIICKSQSLKILKLRHCYSIKEIDAPNLVSIEYEGCQTPRLKFARESSQLKHSKIVPICNNNVNAAWFGKLRKFLSNSTSWSQVSLYFPSYRVIYMNDWQMHHRVATPQVDVLNVDIRSSWECPAFVDALLLSCHPRRLNLRSSIKMNKCFVSRLMYMKDSSHPSSHGRETWHSQLIEIKAYDLKDQPLELTSEELAISCLTERREVYFLLDWQCS